MSSTKVSQSTLIVSTVTALYLFTSSGSILGSISSKPTNFVSAASVSKTTEHISPIVLSNWWIFFLAALIGLTLSLCLVLTICTCRSFCSSFTTCDTEACSDDDSESMICFSQQQQQQQSHPHGSVQEHTIPINGGSSSASFATSQLTQVFVGNSAASSSSQALPEEKQFLLAAADDSCATSSTTKGRRIIGLRTVVIDS